MMSNKNLAAQFPTNKTIAIADVMCRRTHYSRRIHTSITADKKGVNSTMKRQNIPALNRLYLRNKGREAPSLKGVPSCCSKKRDKLVL